MAEGREGGEELMDREGCLHSKPPFGVKREGDLGGIRGPTRKGKKGK